MSSITPMKSMIGTIFTAPAEAVLEAEERYRTIWIEWLTTVKKLVEKRKQQLTNDPNVDAKVASMLAEQLKLAPVMKLNGRVEIGLSMRIASVSKSSGNLS